MQLEQQLYSDLDHINVLQQELKVETARLENEQKSYEEMKQNMAINNSRLADLKSKVSLKHEQANVLFKTSS